MGAGGEAQADQAVPEGVPDHVPEGYGAAAGSLSDPACTPGTQQFEAAKRANDAVLEDYWEIHQGYKNQGFAKPDMKASKDIREKLEDAARGATYGHIPGVAVGQVFAGRGELVAVGLHTLYMRGIDCKKGYDFGAVAICMSGRYKDNDDKGATFVYTGAGGQEKLKQVRDQTYSHSDNAALLDNFRTGTPVRVFRMDDSKPPNYTYEGLYKVIAHKKEPSSDGPLVIRFIMQGVPGHFVVSGKVDYKRPKAFQKIQLAGAAAKAKQPAERRKVPKNYIWNFYTPNIATIKQSIAERAAAGKHGKLVCADISGGREKVPIPMWNALDECDKPFVPTQQDHLPVDPDTALTFEYIDEYQFTTADDAALLAQKADKLFKRDCPKQCGILFHGGQCLYTDEKLLMHNDLTGIMECPPGCRGAGKAKAALCKRNRVVAEGIQYPLEVFKVPNKGWGARCAMDVPAGAMLCRYIGVVITDDAAEEQAGADTYLYDLNHFHSLEETEEATEGGRGSDPSRNPRLPLIPEELREHHLTVDASHEGNVARFFNHSCDPNCIMQAVFTMQARSQLLHYMVIVAAEDIPKFTELTYDYGSAYIVEGEPEQSAAAEATAAAAGGAAAVRKRRIPCNCGAYNCRGWLKD